MVDYKDLLNGMQCDYSSQYSNAIIDWCNYIMLSGRVADEKQYDDKEIIKQCHKIMENYPENWEKIENIILSKISKYMSGDIANNYSGIKDSICMGTLRLLSIAYKEKNLDSAQFDDMLENINSLRQSRINSFNDEDSMKKILRQEIAQQKENKKQRNLESKKERRFGDDD